MNIASPSRDARPATAASAPDTAGRILDAAERIFSREGFGGAGMKAIAGEAGVAQGLLHYHFGSKDGLYAAVIERRAQLVSAGRIRLLEAVDTRAPAAIPQIFEAFFRPPLSAEGGGPVFARIFATLAVGNARDQELVRKHYDPTARRFIDALMAAAPGTDRETAALGYSFALGMLIGTIGRDGRLDRLAAPDPQAGTDGDPTSAQATAALIDRLTRHATGGFKALRMG